MKKIPTLFVRDSEDRRYVTTEVTPGCEWALAGEGVATRKYDGTCVLIRRDGMAVHAFSRREVKPGKEPPPGWIEVDHDEVTGKRVGWEPAAQSGFAKWIDEALAFADEYGWVLAPGTYELVGPKINGNPEDVTNHYLIEHATAQVIPLAYPVDFDGLRHRLTTNWPHEGIVWHHPDGRMVKLKRRDFPLVSASADESGKPSEAPHV
jgi:hypothetical protein